MEWKKEITASGRKKQIEVLSGDIVNIGKEYDLLVCSAFKGRYGALPGTLIGNLYENAGISVEEQAAHPEIDRRQSENYWVSSELNGRFKRLGCIELLDLTESGKEEIKTLCKSFSTFYNMLVRMNLLGIAPSNVILPVLGSGNQKIELCYIVPPLINQCIRALTDIECLQTITFCDYDDEKVRTLIAMLESAEKKEKNSDLFISYCSAQREYADCLRKMLTDRGIRCWMAPYSIPTGSSYQAEIPAALSNIPNVLLILSKEAETSRWVQKEVGCAIGARHKLIPVRSSMYQLSQQFSFLLDGEQIYDMDDRLDMENNCAQVADYLSKLVTHARAVTRSDACKSADEASFNKKPDRKNVTVPIKDGVLIAIGITIIIELWTIIRKMK